MDSFQKRPSSLFGESFPERGLKALVFIRQCFGRSRRLLQQIPRFQIAKHGSVKIVGAFVMISLKTIWHLRVSAQGSLLQPVGACVRPGILRDRWRFSSLICALSVIHGVQRSVCIPEEICFPLLSSNCSRSSCKLAHSLPQ